jgi:hypothetical protein
MSDLEPNDMEPGDEDRCSSNVMLRAGYLRGMAMRAPKESEDRKFLLRASKSLLAYAALLDGAANGYPRR